jgi:hypothetical protein
VNKLPGLYRLLFNQRDGIRKTAGSLLDKVGLISTPEELALLLPVLNRLIGSFLFFFFSHFRILICAEYVEGTRPGARSYHWSSLSYFLNKFDQTLFVEQTIVYFSPRLIDVAADGLIGPLEYRKLAFWVLVCASKLLNEKLWSNTDRSAELIVARIIDIVQAEIANKGRSMQNLITRLTEVAGTLAHSDEKEFALRSNQVIKFLLDAKQIADQVAAPVAIESALRLVVQRFDTSFSPVDTIDVWYSFMFKKVNKNVVAPLFRLTTNAEVLSLRSQFLDSVGLTNENMPLLWHNDIWEKRPDLGTEEGFEIFLHLLSLGKPVAFFVSNERSKFNREVVLHKFRQFLRNLLMHHSKTDRQLPLDNELFIESLFFVLISPSSELSDAARGFINGMTRAGENPLKYFFSPARAEPVLAAMLSAIEEIQFIGLNTCLNSLPRLLQHFRDILRYYPLPNSADDPVETSLALVLEGSYQLVLSVFGAQFLRSHLMFEEVISRVFDFIAFAWQHWMFIETANGSVVDELGDWLETFVDLKPKNSTQWTKAFCAIVSSLTIQQIRAKPALHKVAHELATAPGIDPQVSRQLKAKLQIDQINAFEEMMQKNKAKTFAPNVSNMRMPPPKPVEKIPAPQRAADTRMNCVHSISCKSTSLVHFKEFKHPAAVTNRLQPSLRRELNEFLSKPECPDGRRCRNNDLKHASVMRHPDGYAGPKPDPTNRANQAHSNEPQKVRLIAVNESRRPEKSKTIGQTNRELRKMTLDEMLKNVLLWRLEEIKKDVERGSLRKVPTTFESYDEYYSIFQPLLLEEVKAQLIQSEERATFSARLKESRVEDEFTYLDFRQLSSSRDEEISDGDIVQLTCKNGPEYVLGYVDLEKSKHWVCCRVYLKGSSMKLTLESKWELKKLGSLTTTLREYEALCSAERLALSPFLLSKPIPGPTSISGLSLNLKRKITEVYNQSQREAIENCIKSRGFVLIQGPPGTGKTKTILGVLSALFDATKTSHPK